MVESSTMEGGDMQNGSGELSKPARTWLLAEARSAIARAIGVDDPPAGSSEVPAGADAPSGCFVSLHTGAGTLRGCIGTFEGTRPLWEAVREMAEAAAIRDPRFAPLAVEELAGCHLEISALTAPVPAQASEVEVGRHGICVEQGVRRGVLLPQVATDRGWDRETFLDQTCVKAGLPKEAWRSGSVKIEIFSAQVFSEEKQSSTSAV